MTQPIQKQPVGSAGEVGFSCQEAGFPKSHFIGSH
jgi:hypothetical protein